METTTYIEFKCPLKVTLEKGQAQTFDQEGIPDNIEVEIDWEKVKENLETAFKRDKQMIKCEVINDLEAEYLML